jgi:acetyl esterase/lipase
VGGVELKPAHEAVQGLTEEPEEPTMTNTADFPPLRIPERAIPTPRSISPEAQAVLGRAAETPFDWPPYPELKDVAAWSQYAEAANSNMRAMIQASPEPGDDSDCEVLRIGSASCFRFDSAAHSAGRPANVMFELHGGALIGGGGDLCRIMAGRLAARTGASVYAPDYRMPPLHPFPVPLDDCLAAYRQVLTRHAPESIVVHGSSAGGNLAAALVLRLKAKGLPLPAGLVLETPELDLTESGDSFQTNRILDVVLQQGLMPANRLYANGHALNDPFLSPLFGEFTGGWPPTLLTAGTRDLFLSNAVRMLHRLRDAGAAAELLVYEAMPHGGFFGTPEDRLVQKDIIGFARQCWMRQAR